MEEVKDNELDYTDILDRFLKLFVTDEQIEEGKKKYDENYGQNKNESCYASTLKAMRLDGGLDNLNVDFFGDDWFDNFANSLLIELAAIIQCVHSNRTWSSEEYIHLAHITMAIEVDSKKLGGRLIKKIKEEVGKGASFFTHFKYASEDADAVYELLTGEKKPKDINETKRLDIRKG